MEGWHPVGYIPKLLLAISKMDGFCDVFMSCRPCSLIPSHPKEQEKHSSGCLTLPCPARALACRRSTHASTCSWRSVPVRVHEIRAHQKPPIPPASNLVSRFGGRGHGLGQSFPRRKLQRNSCTRHLVFSVSRLKAHLSDDQRNFHLAGFFSAPVTHS